MEIREERDAEPVMRVLPAWERQIHVLDHQARRLDDEGPERQAHRDARDERSGDAAADSPVTSSIPVRTR